MYNKHKKHIFPITSRYIVAAIIGSPLITACSHSRYDMSGQSDAHLELVASISDEELENVLIVDPRPSTSGGVEPAQEAQQLKEPQSEQADATLLSPEVKEQGNQSKRDDPIEQPEPEGEPIEQPEGAYNSL